MSDLVRVYHPSLSTFEDVPAKDVDSWSEAGWRKTAPKHFDAEGVPAVGSHPGFAQIPVLEDVTTTTATGRGTGTGAGTSSTASGSSAGVSTK